jgi:hypothetical protein
MKSFIRDIISRIISSVVAKLLIIFLVAGGSIFGATTYIKNTIYNIFYQHIYISPEMENYTRQRLYNIVNECGVTSGAAWMQLTLSKSIALNFKEVYAYTPYSGIPIGIIPIAPFYAKTFDISGHCYNFFNQQKDGQYIIINKYSLAWSQCQFLSDVRANIWKQTNKMLVRDGKPPIHANHFYIVILKKNDNIVYILALSLSGESQFCHNLGSIDATGRELENIGSVLKTNVLNEKLDF